MVAVPNEILKRELHCLIEEAVLQIVERLIGGSKKGRAIRTASTIVWLSSEEAAERLGVKHKTLQNWRCAGVDQPRYYRQSKTLVRYKRHEIDAWIGRIPVDPSEVGQSGKR